MSAAAWHVALRCDARPSFGVGHLIRSVSLAEELLARGHQVTLLGNLGAIRWVERLVAEHGIPVHDAPAAPEALVAQVAQLGVTAVVLDGYHLDPGLGAALRQADVVVLAMVDAEFGARQEADLYVDQNLGAVARSDLPTGSRALAGLDYALFRDTILQRRRTTEPAQHQPPRLLAVFGGTDPYDAASTVVPLILATGVPVEITVIAARDSVRERLQSLPTASGQSVKVVPPVPDLAALAVTCDVVVSASGSSVWELLCLGVPTGVVCVADNQHLGYEMTAREGVVVPVGVLSNLSTPEHADAAVRGLHSLLTDHERRRTLAARGQQLVDGRGRERVAQALLAP